MSEAMIGLDSLDGSAAAEQGAAMEVRTPDGSDILRWPDGRPWTITYYGMDAERVVKVARDQADRRAAAMMRTRQPTSSAVVDRDNVELLASATKSWDIPLADGSAALNDIKEYRSAYAKYRWLYEQGNEFVGNRGNFMKAPRKS